MCVLYVSFGSKARPRIIFGCVAMRSAVLFIFRSRLLLYSAGYVVNRVQVALSGFSVRLLCFVQRKTLCRYGCMYVLAALVLVWQISQIQTCLHMVVGPGLVLTSPAFTRSIASHTADPHAGLPQKR